jgi:hypothetical protein
MDQGQPHREAADPAPQTRADQPPHQADKDAANKGGRPVLSFGRRIDLVAVAALIVATGSAIYQHRDGDEASERLQRTMKETVERVDNTTQQTMKETLDKVNQAMNNTVKETVVGVAEITRDNRITFNGHEFKTPPGPIMIEFWTPSAQTKNYAGAKDWEKLEDDGRLDEFAEKLMKEHIVKGYRRYDVVGQGSRGPRQAGAWWISSNDSSFDMKAFLLAYYEFWKPGEDNVYMEVTPVAFAYRPAP